jgi:hypothetical protein
VGKNRVKHRTCVLLGGTKPPICDNYRLISTELSVVLLVERRADLATSLVLPMGFSKKNNIFLHG